MSRAESEEEHEETARIAFVTAPDLEVGRRLARRLVEERLAACVNLLPGLVSIYRWQGAVEEDSEVLLVVKTRASKLAAVEALLEREHPYDCPECVALEPARVEARYLAWLLAETS